MDQKAILTKHILSELQIITTEKSYKEWYRLWWINPRPNGLNSMRVTERGCEDFEIKAKLKCYTITFPKPLEEISNKFILDLERFIDGPYYITRKYIKVFTEKTAIQLVLFGGDLEKFNLAKTMSQKNNTSFN